MFLFLDEKSRRNRDITPQNEITRRQRVFKGVFSKARVRNIEKDDDDDDEEADNNEGAIFDF